MNDVNVSPGSSTSPTSDPGRETVFTEVPRQGPAAGWRAFSSKPVKWTIGRFYWLTRRTRSSIQLWRHGSDFTYTKNSAMGRSDCIYTKNSARPRSDFPYTKNGGDASENGDFQRRKQRLQGVHFFQELSFYIQKELTNDFFQINFENALRPVENQGDDATENDNFQRGKQRLQ